MMENKAPQALDVTVKNYEGVADLSVGTLCSASLLCLWAVDLGFLGMEPPRRLVSWAWRSLCRTWWPGWLEQEGTVPGREYLHTLARCLGHAAVCSTRLMPCSQGPGFLDYSVVGIAFTLAGLYLACMLRRSACLASCPPYIVWPGRALIDYTGAILSSWIGTVAGYMIGRAEVSLFFASAYAILSAEGQVE